MIGISKESLLALREHCQCQSDLELYNYLLTKCQELNQWMPIETAPRDGRYLRLYDGLSQIDGRWFSYSESLDPGFWAGNDMSLDPTHWQELPEDPKT